MKFIKEKKVFVVLAFLAAVLFIGASYAFISFTLTGTKTYSIVGGELKLILDEANNELTIGQTDAIPVADYQGMQQDGYNFTLKNQGGADINYYVYIEDTEEKTMPDEAVRYGLRKNNEVNVTVGEVSELENKLLVSGKINRRQDIDFNLKFWIGESATNEQVIGKIFSVRLKVVGEQIASLAYQDDSGAADPKLEGELIAVTIDDEGVVRKANLYEEWYDYDKSIWANAVIVNDDVYTEYVNAKATTVIPESDIESYFVWIPRYRYKIFDEGKYETLGTKENAEQPIEIEFETNETPASTGSSEGTWLTHPAFTSFDNSNGFWVAKFESGYKGATSAEDAQKDVSDVSKLVIKPNQYIWRYVTVGKSFEMSYDYNRDLDSHMMKNTEWGAVAYLSHSKYGHVGSVRVNNNIYYVTGYAATEEPTVGYRDDSKIESKKTGVDGVVTVNYLNQASVIASTTNNYSGVYDMSGGAWEYVMGNVNNVTLDSEITNFINDFYTNSSWSKYYDKYPSQTSYTVFNNRILGDATGEMGPFYQSVDPDNGSRNKSSWYDDYSLIPTSSLSWYSRGGHCGDGIGSGVFAFHYRPGNADLTLSFRIVLTP